MEKSEKSENPDPTSQLYRVLPKSTKYLTTVAIFFGNIAFGCTFNAFSPALVDLRNKYDTDISTISIVFTILTGSYLLGALTSGFVYNILNRQLGIIILLTGMSVSMYTTPHCPSVITFFMAGALLGYSCGAYDAAQVVWMMEMWQNEAGPFIQAQHFCYALGSLIPSLLLAPFLTEDPDEDDVTNPVPTTTTESSLAKNSDMYIPFTIAGGLASLAALYVGLLFIFRRYHPPPPEENRIVPDVTEYNKNSDEAENGRDVGAAKLLKHYRIKLILLSAMFLGAYQGMEICTMQFMPTFAQYGLGLSERQGARVLTWLNAAYAAGRFSGILLILKVPAQFILCVNILLIVSSNVLLLLFGDNSLTLLRVGCVLLGLGFSTIYASFCGFIERHLIFTNFVGAFMMVCGSFVAAIYPLIIGNIIDTNPNVMTYTSFFSVTLCIIAFGILYKLTYKNMKSRPVLK